MFKTRIEIMSKRRINSLFALTLLAGGCAGAPPSNLVDARAAYQRASAGPAADLAPAQLHVARTSLTLAEKTYDDEGDSPNARDRAYIAMRKSELAEVQARIAHTTQETAAMQQRGAEAEQAQHVATAEELARTRAQLATERGVNANQASQLQTETERRQQAEAAQKQALDALSKLENVKKDARGTVITLSGSVIFPSGKSDLLPSARGKLAEVATALAQGDPASKIVVEGHTDSVGGVAMNQTLSLKRAEAVRDELIAQGVSGTRVSVEGFGPSRPVADNDSPAGRANNRRVEIVVQPASPSAGL
jgi:outer membrane protein OmpA-like peptidoglycan-associated protein